MKYYYLINNRIMSANKKMPDKMDYVSNKITDYMGAEHSFNHLAHKNDYDNWLNVLQPCEISESELEKLKNKLVSCGYVLSLDTIEVTDIVELEWNKKYAVYELFFKQPKQVEEIEAVDMLLNTFGQYCTLNGIKLTDSNKVGQAVIDFKKSDIYEIFKNQK